MINLLGQPCDEEGNYLPAGTPPTRTEPDSDNWAPFASRVQFETAELLYKKVQMSAGNLDSLFELWTASNIQHGGSAPFAKAQDMYDHIDGAAVGDVPWQSFTLKYEGDVDPERSPSWKAAEHTVWFRDPHEVVKALLANPDFADDIEFSPHRDYDATGHRRFSDFMSGDWSWEQAVRSGIRCLEDQD